MAGGSKSEKSSKKRKEKTAEKIVFHDCESDQEMVQVQNTDQSDLSHVAQRLEDPNAFHKELQAIVSTTQQLLCKFDSQYKPPNKKQRKRMPKNRPNVSESDRSLRSAKSLMLEIHLQMAAPSKGSNVTYHQMSTQNANVYQVLQTQPPMEQIGYKTRANAQMISESDTTKPTEECTAGDHKNILTLNAQPKISENFYLTPQTSATCFSILTNSQIDIQVLHSQSKLITIKQPKSHSTETSKQTEQCNDFETRTSVLGKASTTLRCAGANILFQGKRFMSSISNYMGGYVDTSEKQPSETCNVPKKRYLSPKASRARQQRAKRKMKPSAPSNPFKNFPQFTLPPEFAALAANGQTMPAIVMFMPTPQDASSSQQQLPLPLQAFCIPIMQQGNLTTKTSKPNTKCSTATQKQTLIADCRPHDDTQLEAKASCQTWASMNSELSCHCPNESQELCVAVTQLNEEKEEYEQCCETIEEDIECCETIEEDFVECCETIEEDFVECFETIEEEIECWKCVSDVTIVAAPSEHILEPIVEEEPEGVCCARSKRGECVACANITSEERERKRSMLPFKTTCTCGLTYMEKPTTKVTCTCNADGMLDENCKLPLCIDQYGVCPCDCQNKQSIVKCCNEAFQENCICTDYNVPKLYRLALPQHKDLNLCIKCRFDPSPLIDAEGKVFCPGDCGCCLCPWQQRPTISVENLMLHEKVRVCSCRERGTIFNLSPKNSKCTNPGNFDLCPCRERAEAKFLELYEKEMFKIDATHLNALSGPAVTLKDVQEVITLKEKQNLTKKK